MGNSAYGNCQSGQCQVPNNCLDNKDFQGRAKDCQSNVLGNVCRERGDPHTRQTSRCDDGGPQEEIIAGGSESSKALLPGLRQDAFALRPDWLDSYLQNKKVASDLPRTKDRPLFPGNDRDEIQVSRRQPFDMEIVREGKYWRTLGLIVSGTDNPRHLVVEDIWSPSLVSEWNEKRPKDSQVQIGDIIVEANGESADNRSMLQAIQGLGKGSVVKLRIE
mmetsp:Transcript_26791/g.46473  ORF Transcript_26791/g.46473 Transcript_26791/m.46473 type:complete len:219 (-) Transcript_26791:54-710(-)